MMSSNLLSTHNEHGPLVCKEVFGPEPEKSEEHIQPDHGQEKNLQQSMYLRKGAWIMAYSYWKQTSIQSH